MATINSTLSTPLCGIVSEMVADMQTICRNQTKPTNWRNKFAYAAPYIDACRCLQSVDDNYGFDSGRSLVNYMLANLGTYRGEKAKEFKALLKQLVKR